MQEQLKKILYDQDNLRSMLGKVDRAHSPSVKLIASCYQAKEQPAADLVDVSNLVELRYVDLNDKDVLDNTVAAMWEASSERRAVCTPCVRESLI